MLEPYDGKLSRTVLRGEEGRKPLALPGAAYVRRTLRIKPNPAYSSGKKGMALFNFKDNIQKRAVPFFTFNMTIIRKSIGG